MLYELCLQPHPSVLPQCSIDRWSYARRRFTSLQQPKHARKRLISSTEQCLQLSSIKSEHSPQQHLQPRDYGVELNVLWNFTRPCIQALLEQATVFFFCLSLD